MHVWIIKRLMVLGAIISMICSGFTASIAYAESPTPPPALESSSDTIDEDPPPSEDDAGLSDLSEIASETRVALDTIGCWSSTQEPYRLTTSGKTIYAETKITRCTSPEKPDDCRVQAEILRWYAPEKIWITVAEGPAAWTSTCKIGTKSQAKYSCTPIAGGLSYKMRTWLTIRYKGQTAVNHKDSNFVKIGCD